MAIRETLYATIEKSTRLDVNFLILVVLSTVVAAIGLIKHWPDQKQRGCRDRCHGDCPLLGPNLAL